MNQAKEKPNEDHAGKAMPNFVAGYHFFSSSAAIGTELFGAPRMQKGRAQHAAADVCRSLLSIKRRVDGVMCGTVDRQSGQTKGGVSCE